MGYKHSHKLDLYLNISEATSSLFRLYILILVSLRIIEDYRGSFCLFRISVLGWLFLLLLYSLRQQLTTAWKSASLLFLLFPFSQIYL